MINLMDKYAKPLAKAFENKSYLKGKTSNPSGNLDIRGLSRNSRRASLVSLISSQAMR